MHLFDSLSYVNAPNVKTLIRLDASPYQAPEFFKKEEELARDLGLGYHFSDFRHTGKLNPDLGPCVLISNTHTPTEKIPREILDKTQLWLHPNSGYDNFSAQWVEKQSFPIVLGNSIRAPGVSEYILACLFHHTSFPTHQESWSQSRKWNRPLLKDKRVTIIGKGQVGTRLYQSLFPLVDELKIFDPYLKEDSLFEGSLEDLAKQTDILILAASLNKDNRKMISEKVLAALPKDFCLINAARGELIDQGALIQTLKNSPEAFAYLDVFEKEPFKEEFTQCKNVHTTSHLAGVSQSIEERILSFEKETLNTFLSMHLESFKEEFKKDLLKNRLIGRDLI